MFVAKESETIETSEDKNGVKQRGNMRSGVSRKRNGGDAVDGGAMMRSERDDLRFLLIYFPILQMMFCVVQKYSSLHNETDL